MKNVELFLVGGAALLALGFFTGSKTKDPQLTAEQAVAKINYSAPSSIQASESVFSPGYVNINDDKTNTTYKVLSSDIDKMNFAQKLFINLGIVPITRYFA